MTSDQFVQALSALELRIAEMQGTAARALSDRIALHKSAFTPFVEEDQLADIQSQMTVLELQHDVSRLECGRVYVMTHTSLSGQQEPMGTA